MMTLAEAQAAVAEACHGHWRITADLVEWGTPQEDLATWVDIVGDESALGHDVTVAKAIVAALMAYLAHLSHEAGKSLSDTAVRRALNDAILSAPLASSREALRAVEHTIASGLHYAEPKAA